MSSPGSFDHLRHAALDMLDAGNSMASVSRLLAVPMPVIARWRAEPVPPRPGPGATNAKNRATAFPTTLVVARGFPHPLLRHVAVGYALAALTVGAFAWSLHQDGSLVDDLEIDLALLLVCVAWWFQRRQPLFTLSRRAIVVPGLLGARKMPYAELADWWLVMHVKHEGTDEEVEGRLLTLHSRRAGVRPIEVFVDDHVEIDPPVIERLDQVKQANRDPGPLSPMGTG